MQRRELLKKTAMAVAAFSLSRELFAHQPFENLKAGFHADVIKLSANENPHGPSPMARKAMAEAVSSSNRYPWEVTGIFREKIAALTGHTKEHITVGAGSSELLGLVSAWAALQKGNAVAPDPTFRLWMPAARRIGLDIKLVPLATGKKMDLQRLKDAMNADTKMVYICNPNNPTGTVIPANELEGFIKDIAPGTIILLDEAYTEFSSEPSMAKWVNDFPNLIIAKTFSKIYGMAGARVGYALAHPQTIGKLNEIQPWANAGVSAVSLAGAMASLDDHDFVRYCKQENEKARTIFYKALEKASMPYIPSQTSFVYFDSSAYGKDVPKLLEENQIIGARTFEQGSKWLRLSIGTVDEMQKVADALNR
jgi:histidinol-phosphate aminotransferase